VAERATMTQAIADGNAAGLAGAHVTTCPHPRGSLLRAAWVKGYARARPVTPAQGTTP
jgi:ribosome modulation factor